MFNKRMPLRTLPSRRNKLLPRRIEAEALSEPGLVCRLSLPLAMAEFPSALSRRVEPSCASPSTSLLCVTSGEPSAQLLDQIDEIQLKVKPVPLGLSRAGRPAGGRV